MAKGTKSFSDLLSEAPMAPNEDTVTLVGALARSSHQGKFVLTTSPGNSITLDVDAVKEFHSIGGSVGQPLVQITVDRAKVPESSQTAAPDRQAVTGIHDYKLPNLEKHPWLETIKTFPTSDPWEFTEREMAGGTPIIYGTGVTDHYKHPILDKYPWEEPIRTHPLYGAEEAYAPFALATPQQAPEAALAAMRTSPSGPLSSIIDFDVRTGWRDHWKNPALDITGRLPYPD